LINVVNQLSQIIKPVRVSEINLSPNFGKNYKKLPGKIKILAEKKEKNSGKIRLIKVWKPTNFTVS